jgi:hypothetical protein
MDDHIKVLRKDNAELCLKVDCGGVRVPHSPGGQSRSQNESYLLHSQDAPDTLMRA